MPSAGKLIVLLSADATMLSNKLLLELFYYVAQTLEVSRCRVAAGFHNLGHPVVFERRLVFTVR